MIRQGLISTNAATPLRPTTDIASANVEWPESLEDYSGSLTNYSKELISSKNMADIWMWVFKADWPWLRLICIQKIPHPRRFGSDFSSNGRTFVVKVPRLPGGLSTTSPEDDQFQQFLRIAAKERFELDHENLVDLIGLDKSYGRYPGIVLEYCPYGDLTHPKLREISQGLQYLHNLSSALVHGDLTPDNILVDGQGTLKLSIISFARVAASLPVNTQVAARPESAISARYTSPELLVDNPEASPESDMWSFGCVAFWIYTDLHPYPNLKKEYDIVRAIESGTLPNDMDSIRNIEALGSHLKTGADSPWITNGTLSHILRCWDSQAKARPSAKDIIKHLDLLPNTGVVRWRPPSGVPDLTGAVQTPGGRSIIGWSAGTWRRIYTRRAQGKTPDIIKLWWWKGVYSRGFFRKNLDVTVKSAKSDKGEFEDPVQQVPALITEYCANGRLREIRGIAQALKYIHDDIPEGSIVHGNLSMDSVVVDTTGTPKLTNFEFGCQYQHTDNPVKAQVLNAPPLASHPTRWDAPELFQDVSDSRAPFPTRLIAFDQNGEKPYAEDDCAYEIRSLASSLWEDIPYQRSSASKVLEMIEILLTHATTGRLWFQTVLSVSLLPAMNQARGSHYVNYIYVGSRTFVQHTSGQLG
ncbi:Pkinase domain-containing protein [Rhizoctonia solani AG-1 IA]|uniref:Pkinase domain-containing protein n=1 Tax=Thanatephorus cucumeris (strain AG1-IA) TaxID=983506 RepID=L8WQU8_THACA|nr:Pkinase domain-containing protein [Rhizoctonia solani AG-1 IA]